MGSAIPGMFVAMAYPLKNMPLFYIEPLALGGVNVPMISLSPLAELFGSSWASPVALVAAFWKC